MLGEFQFVCGAVGVGEGQDEGTLGLGGGVFAGDAVLFGLDTRRLVRGGRAVHLTLGPPRIAFDAVVAFPAQGPGGGQCGGEVAGAAGGGRQPGGARRAAAAAGP
ncbi:hypothetical protein [Streptomyces hygroscopicus]|uniref:hypothetical protein n=1 Tax=Streptomyces hygroscopicus TaxID=1912 RepID=UPI0033D0C7D6